MPFKRILKLKLWCDVWCVTFIASLHAFNDMRRMKFCFVSNTERNNFICFVTWQRCAIRKPFRKNLVFFYGPCVEYLVGKMEIECGTAIWPLSSHSTEEKIFTWNMRATCEGECDSNERRSRTQSRLTNVCFPPPAVLTNKQMKKKKTKQKCF